MINYYLETYKEYRKETSPQSDWKRILFAVGIILIPSIVLMVNISWIVIYEIVKKQEISSNWKIFSFFLMIAYVVLLMIASFVDNRWRTKSYVLKYNDRIEKIILLKGKFKDYYKFDNNSQYELIIDKIKGEKDKVIACSNTWLNNSKKAFFSLFIVVFVALTPATITGLMNNYGKKEAEILNRKEFLDTFTYFILVILLLLFSVIIIWIAMGRLYSSIGKNRVRILEDFEEDMQIIIEIQNGLHPFAIQIISEMEKKKKENDEKYLNNANKAREITDRNSFSS
ncbi:hypothetical protein [Ruminococcus flavefaciens]|uniref:hypothetical protein n=1 Tax=Ruminococcus flavefaciens TaxID=1265 RepID=UPI0026EFE5E2|nr:hypothetical protein [Ruminococcus flavefaciens]